MRSRAFLVVTALAATAAACGGKITPVVDDLTFAPQKLSAGYGFIGGMHVAMVDPTTDGVRRTLRIDAKGLDGSYSVAAGTVTVTLTEARSDGTTVTYSTVSGTVSIQGTDARGSSERVQVDLLVADPAESWHELHLAGTWVAPLDYYG